MGLFERKNRGILTVKIKLFWIFRCRCPAHGNPGATSVWDHGKTRSTVANITTDKEYAFEVKFVKTRKLFIRILLKTYGKYIDFIADSAIMK